ncbi:aldo/keto reductase [Parablautia muri]|uniref:Aldo/keto reductase n=1 Tax=Parablautia muri TaxID=2320879 RepID=A0A9X5BG34_9FIRM|nr:aldo/keto reductase [Parablautia muri]NBJ92497.1 aldo/keto reductase [Parablautia muri]
MKYIEKYGMKLSKIGLGTGRFGTRIEEEISFEMLDRFVENGGNVIDTARNYYEWVENGRGISEKTIGKWMAKRCRRSDVYISTKGGVRNENINFFVNLSYNNLLDEIEQSREALQTDNIDIYLLHRDEQERHVEEIVENLQKIQEKIKAKAIGVCNWKAERVMKANKYAKLHGLIPIQIIQTWWSIAAYTPDMWNDPTTTYMDQNMYEYLKKHNMLGMAYTSQAKGFFQKAISEGVDNLDPFLKKRIATPENLERLERIREYSNKNGISPTAVVNGYITDNEVDGIALVSCSKLEQLYDILENCDVIINEDWLKEMAVEK